MKLIVVTIVIGALGAVLVNFKEYRKRIGVNVWFRKQHCWGQQRYQGKYCPGKKKGKRDLGPVVTCCNPLPRTINQAEYPAWVYKERTPS